MITTDYVAQLRRAWRHQDPRRLAVKHLEVVALLTEAVGHCIDIYWGAGECAAECASRESFQIMPESEPALDSALGRFWEWHLTCNRQWFPTPLEAATNYALAWRLWLDHQSSRPRAA